MTWSIIARDEETGAFGIVAASRFFALGAVVPWIKSGVGAVATQAMVNPMLGPAVLDRLAAGDGVDAALENAWGDDTGGNVRQIHVVDQQGNRAAHTGGDCVEWCGDMAGPNISIAGNMLVGGSVLQASLDEYKTKTSLPFAERLLASLLAGDRAGGDMRGRQSAVLKVYTDEIYPDWDIRVDDHPSAPDELLRIYQVGLENYAGFKEFLPTHANPAGMTDPAKLAAMRKKS